MKLVTYGAPGEEEPGLLIADEIMPLTPLLEHIGVGRQHDLSEVVRRWPAITQAMSMDGSWRRTLPSQQPQPRQGPRFTLPLRSPGKIVGVGSNYRSAEGTLPDLPDDSIFFLKPCSALIGPGDTVILPSDARLVVSEIELAIVIGKAGRRVPRSEAMEYVFGYTVANDITAPEVLLGESHRNPLFLQAARAKGYPTFCPLGPWIVTADELTRPRELVLEQEIDGEVVARARADLMIRDVPTLVHEVSHAFGLEPGDIILSGSPRPTGARTPLTHGSRLRSRIRGLGELDNPVRREGVCSL